MQLISSLIKKGGCVSFIRVYILELLLKSDCNTPLTYLINIWKPVIFWRIKIIKNVYRPLLVKGWTNVNDDSYFSSFLVFVSSFLSTRSLVQEVFHVHVFLQKDKSEFLFYLFFIALLYYLLNEVNRKCCCFTLRAELLYAYFSLKNDSWLRPPRLRD